ncbi:inactive Rho GTPase-activating protein 11B-like isoform X2 [Hippocampus zosterae]|uniref:inactive Rho GTPase-activating protein 11B-like isoform X2 n=1 Tax=Hippocampus zosterae TaxID=109293 RepID=UPI00223D0DC2|nr:inactive Rho GTPase-activating protein 11B-like isoform X2 [Hippocampus zosterae]
MKITDSDVIRFHLRVLHGINVKSVESKTERLFASGAKVFGVPLENLSRRFIPEFGLVPGFLVDACSFLLERAGTVGLFRKPGSLPRIKSLRAKLNRGEACLSTAFAYDVATLVKQFCRELPEPLIPAEIHAALLKAQTLDSLQDRTSALQLLSCLLPARNSSCLHYLLDFLSKVTQRCEENLMTSSNLATVFAPCLLPPPNKQEMSEGRFELRIFVLRTFIEKPQMFGVIPKAFMDSMEFLVNCPLLKDAHSKKHVLWSVKTVSWIQGKAKVRPAVHQGKSESNLRGRPSLRRSVGLEVFPNIAFFRACMSCEDSSPAAAFLDALSPSGKQPSPNRIKRDMRLGLFPGLGQGQTESFSVFNVVGKLQVASWSRRISL